MKEARCAPIAKTPLKFHQRAKHLPFVPGNELASECFGTWITKNAAISHAKVRNSFLWVAPFINQRSRTRFARLTPFRCNVLHYNEILPCKTPMLKAAGLHKIGWG